MHLLKTVNEHTDYFRFNHHCILHTLDSHILCQLFQAIRERRQVSMITVGTKPGTRSSFRLCPIRICISTQTGRQYVLGIPQGKELPVFRRVGAIASLTLEDPIPRWEEPDRRCREEAQPLGRRPVCRPSPGAGGTEDRVEAGEDCIVRLARIRSCSLLGPADPAPALPELPRSELTFLLHDRRNALERVLLHFSHLEKRTAKLGEDQYQVTIRYDSADQSELLIRILSFGPMIQVLSPPDFIEDIRARLRRQRNLTSSAAGPQTSLP